MYIRWNKRRQTRLGLVKGTNGKYRNERGVPKDSYALTAALVESKRVNGSPRQRFVAYLGTIQVWDDREQDAVIGTGGTSYEDDIVKFWRDVGKRLDGLGDAVPGRKQIESKIAKVVRRPDGEVLQRQSKARKVWLAQIDEALSAFGPSEQTAGTTPVEAA